jgi:hypothetical protein
MSPKVELHHSSGVARPQSITDNCNTLRDKLRDTCEHRAGITKDMRGTDANRCIEWATTLRRVSDFENNLIGNSILQRCSLSEGNRVRIEVNANSVDVRVSESKTSQKAASPAT